MGALISFAFAIPYIVDTVKGKVKPNRATWFILSIAPMLALAGEINEGVGMRSIITFMSGFTPLMFFLASFVNKKSYWKLTKLDYTLAGLSLLGLVLYILSGQGNVAIVFAILADGLGFAPTLIKAYKYPETENYLPFIGGCISVVIGLLTITDWSFAEWAFPMYLLLANCTMIYFVGIRPKLQKQ